MDSPIDHAVGVILHKKVGDAVRLGEPLCTLLVNDESRLQEAAALILDAYTIAAEPVAPQPLIVERIAAAPAGVSRHSIASMKVGSDAQADLAANRDRRARAGRPVVGRVAAGPTTKPGGAGGHQGSSRPARPTAEAEGPARARASSPRVVAGPCRSRRVYRLLDGPVVVASSPCRNRSICSTSPIGSAGSSGCWRSWASPSSCRITAGRSRGRVVFWGLALQWGFALLVLASSRRRQFPRAGRQGGRVDPGLRARGSRVRLRQRAGRSTRARRSSSSPSACLPTVIFVAALFAVLYHLGVMQWVVRGFAVVMAWLMGTSGAESLNVAASLFLGQTEAPLTIRPYLPRLTDRSC